MQYIYNYPFSVTTVPFGGINHFNFPTLVTKAALNTTTKQAKSRKLLRKWRKEYLLCVKKRVTDFLHNEVSRDNLTLRDTLFTASTRIWMTINMRSVLSRIFLFRENTKIFHITYLWLWPVTTFWPTYKKKLRYKN